jgi:hypothetical protein
MRLSQKEFKELLKKGVVKNIEDYKKWLANNK